MCPPAVMAGTVATVPTVRRAVHHLTAPRHAAAHHVARAPARAVRPVNCVPVTSVALPAEPLVTYAAPIPNEPLGPVGGGGGTGPALGALGVGAPAAVAALATPPPASVPAPGDAGAVPEPATWLMLIGGIGVTGAALRRRRRPAAARLGGTSARAAAALWSGGAVAEVGDVAAAVHSTVAAKLTVAGIAGKALMCVCPAAVAVGGVMAVPSLRHAVHAVTAPPVVTGAVQAAGPCDVIPVSATSLNGFPATISTTPARTA